MTPTKFTYSSVTLRGDRTHYPLRVKKIVAANEGLINEFFAEPEAWRRTLIEVVVDTRNSSVLLFYVEQTDE